MAINRTDTHGKFEDNAQISQAIKRAMRNFYGWSRLPAHQKEALEMIAVKMARIVSGDSEFQDHWDDIKGYANLGAKE